MSLTSGYAAIAGPPRQRPHGPIEQPGSADNNAASRRYAPSYGPYEGAYVDLVGTYSNLSDHVKGLRPLLDLPPAARPMRSESPPKLAQNRLRPEAEAVLVATYRAGGKVTKLAAEFDIHRTTVSAILKRHGVLRPPGVQAEDLPRVVRLYSEGWSLARLGAEFDVSSSTVNRALRDAGVRIRRPGMPGRRPNPSA